MPTPGNYGAISVAPGVPIGGDTQLNLLLHTKEVYPGQRIYFLLPQLDGAGSFISEEGLDILASIRPVSDLAPLVQNNSKFSQSTVHPSDLYSEGSLRPDSRPLHNLQVENLFPSQPSLKHLYNPPRPLPHNNWSPSQPIQSSLAILSTMDHGC